MSDFDGRAPQAASKKKAKRQQGVDSSTAVTNSASVGAPGQSWWDWGTSAVSGMASSVTALWSTGDSPPSRIQPSTAHTTPNPAPTDDSPPSRIQPKHAQPAVGTTTDVSPASATATSDGTRKRRHRGKRKGKGEGERSSTVADMATVTTEAPGQDVEHAEEALAAAPPKQPESAPRAPGTGPQTAASSKAAVPKAAAASKPESTNQRAARLLAEAKERVLADIDTVIAGARNVESARRERGLSRHSLDERLARLAALYRKGQEWHEIERLVAELKASPDARPESIATEEGGAKTHYAKSEHPMVEQARRVLELAATYKVDVSKATRPHQLLAELDAALSQEPPGYTRARKLGRTLQSELAGTAVPADVELAVKCTGQLDDLRRVIQAAEAAAEQALAPSTVPALPSTSKTKRSADQMAEKMRQYEAAMAATPRDWTTISYHVRDARRAAERVHHEIAVAPKRAEDMVGGNDVPLERQKIAELHGDGLPGEVEAVREALRSIHGHPLAEGERRWTGGGGKWGADHGNYHPQYGHSYGEHSGPLPPLSGGARYLEYYVRPAPGAADRRRVVRSKVDKRIWYTWDHYNTFVLLDET